MGGKRAKAPVSSAAPRSETPDLHWYPAGATANVLGFRLTGGLFYLAPGGAHTEVSAIDPSLRVGNWRDFRSSTLPSQSRAIPYSHLNFTARAGYLAWLAGGRRGREAPVSFVLLYFCGLERRIVRQLQRGLFSLSDLPAVRQEVRELAGVYRHDSTFRERASQFLHLLDYLSESDSWKVSARGGAAPGQTTYQSANPAGYLIHYGEPSRARSELSRSVPPARAEAKRPAPAPEERLLDPANLRAVQEETRKSDALLAAVYEEDEDDTEGAEGSAPEASSTASPQEPGAVDTEPPRLAPELVELLGSLAGCTECDKETVSALARQQGLMVDGALAEINEYVEDAVGTLLAEDDGEVVRIDQEALAELRDAGLLPSAPSQRPHPAATQRPAPPRWVPEGERVLVHGREITAGLFYLGSPREGEDDNHDPALIDPTLPVAPGPQQPPVSRGRDYRRLTPEARGAYLEWLAGGRQSTLGGDGALFLFLYGVERRVLVELSSGDSARELSGILEELTSLIERFGKWWKQFRDRASALRAVIERLAFPSGDSAAQSRPAPGPEAVVEQVRYGLGQMAAHNRRVPADWALAWVVHHPELRPELAVRTSPGFHSAFRERFGREFPDGMAIPRVEAEFVWEYRPANPTLEPMAIPVRPVPDVFGSQSVFRDLRPLVSAATNALLRPAEPTPARPKATVPEPAKPAPSRPTRWSTWKGPGVTVSAGRFTIRDAMLYTGHAPGNVEQIGNIEWASAIDLHEEFEASVTDPTCTISRPVTGYADLNPRERGRYLLWLTDRSRCAGVPVVFAQLFRNGLERRIVSLLQESGIFAGQQDALARELRQLLDNFGEDPKFAEGTRRLLTLLDLKNSATASSVSNPPRYAPDVREMPFELKLGIGRLARDGGHLPADWAVEWALHRAQPADPERIRNRVDPARRFPSFSPATLREAPGLSFHYEAACPGLGALDVPVPGVKDLSHAPLPEELVALVRPPVPREEATAGPPSPERICRAYIGLALDLARLAGRVTSAHRVAIMRGAEHLATPEDRTRIALEAHTLETDGAADPSALCDELAALPLREREIVGDLLLTAAETTGLARPEQVAYLLSAHRRLGLEAVLRLRLSHRGLAPPPETGAVDKGSALPEFPRPVRGTEPLPPPHPALADLEAPYVRLLLAVVTRSSWPHVDLVRLAAWYGLEVLDAIDIINEAALGATGADVLDDRTDPVTVRIDVFKEMTS